MTKVHSDELLRQEVEKALSGADAETVSIITAVAGLLAAVAYADRSITDDEAAHLKDELRRINGLPPQAVDSVADLLHDHAVRLTTTFVPRFTRTLRELLPEETRMEVLDALLSMAAADGTITFDEVSSLRNITTALALSQAHYNELQSKYRDLLKLT